MDTATLFEQLLRALYVEKIIWMDEEDRILREQRG